MKIAHVSQAVANAVGGVGGGSLHAADNRSASSAGGTLLRGEEGAPDNYRLHYSPGRREGLSEETRHRHNFDQFRRALDGDYLITDDKVIPAGWIGYFPESTFYGPKKRSTEVATLNLQFGAPRGHGYTSVGQRQRAYAELTEKGGTFESGVYTWYDESGKRHNDDAYDAVWEQIYGRRVEYAEARYDNFVLMNPAAFPWVKDDSRAGVARKHIGIFSEREIRVGFIHLDQGASLMFGSEPAGEVMYLDQGELAYDGEIVPRFSAIGSAAGDTPEEFVAHSEAELYYIKLPTF